MKNCMSKKISFIIPAYNAEQYIESCLSRIFSVSYDNYDVIVVDDGSTDRTASILTLLNNPKLKVIRQENSGVSSARNAGLNLTDADYVIFIDVDDIVLPEQIDKLLCKIRFDRDVYMYAYEHQENEVTQKMPLPLSGGDYEKKSVSALCTRLLDVRYVKYYQSSYFGAKIYQYLFSVEFLREHQLNFPIGLPFAEDCVFCYRVFWNEPTLTVIDLAAYRYIVYPGSASHKYRPQFWREIKDFYNAICEVNHGTEPANNKELFYYYYTDIIERAVVHTRQIGKKETMRVIRELYRDVAYCQAAADAPSNLMTSKEKIVRALYRFRKPTITYLFFRATICSRGLRKGVKKRRSIQDEN